MRLVVRRIREVSLVIGFCWTVQARADLIGYRLDLDASPSRAGGTGTLTAEVTGDPATSSIVSLEVDVAGRHFEGFLWVSAQRFDAQDLLGFQVILGEGTGQAVYHGNPLPPEFTPLLAYPAIGIGDQPVQTYAIFKDGGNSDMFANWAMTRISTPVPEGSSVGGFFLLGSVVLTGLRCLGRASR